jgi:hypothetical protein
MVAYIYRIKPDYYKMTSLFQVRMTNIPIFAVFEGVVSSLLYRTSNLLFERSVHFWECIMNKRRQEEGLAEHASAN